MLLFIFKNYVPSEDKAEGIQEAAKLAQAAVDDLKDFGNGSKSANPTPLPEPFPHKRSRFNPY